MAGGGSSSSGGPSFPSVLSEARQLATRLIDVEKSTEPLGTSCQVVNGTIVNMKQYKESLHEFTDLCRTDKPRSHLVQSLQRENRQIRRLQAENRELKQCLHEHQTALELIMQKYRQLVLRVTELRNSHQLVEKALALAHKTKGSQLKCSQSDDESGRERVESLARRYGPAIDQCLEMAEEASRGDQSEMARLRLENSTLRRLLQVGATGDRQLADESRRQLAATAEQHEEKVNSGETTPVNKHCPPAAASSMANPPSSPPTLNKSVGVANRAGVRKPVAAVFPAVNGSCASSADSLVNGELSEETAAVAVADSSPLQNRKPTAAKFRVAPVGKTTRASGAVLVSATATSTNGPLATTMTKTNGNNNSNKSPAATPAVRRAASLGGSQVVAKSPTGVAKRRSVHATPPQQKQQNGAGPKPKVKVATSSLPDLKLR